MIRPGRASQFPGKSEALTKARLSQSGQEPLNKQPKGDHSAMDSHTPPRVSTAAALTTAAMAATPHNKVADTSARSVAQFEREVLPMRQTLYRHALHMCQNHHDAEDLVQETMAKAYRNFHSYESNSNLSAWLYRIQTNTYINGYRQRQRQPVHHSTDGITDHELANQARRISNGHASAEDQALGALPDSDIVEAMRCLPDQTRAVVYYADVEGLRYQEIADMMGTPLGTVSSRLQRGRRRLRRLLADGAHSRPAEDRVPKCGSARCSWVRRPSTRLLHRTPGHPAPS
jgi:RNA polymerase sigma-70 factor, ECF subfamily